MTPFFLWGIFVVSLAVAATSPWGPFAFVFRPGAPDYDSVLDAASAAPDPPDHLVVMVHGLYGDRGNWRVISRRLRRRLRGRGALLFASRANQFDRTFSGIDSCARRLAGEIASLRARHPGLARVSFLAHSMGGLISRYAAGANFDPAAKTVFGMRPCHFVAIATPHLGCHWGGEARVPFLAWAEAVPLLGTVVRATVRAYSPAVAEALCKATGRQLYLADGHDGSSPLVARLVEDVPGEGYFYSSLAAFKTRTLYANSWGDAMVGWANASLRRERELPWGLVHMHKGMGVFREDPIEAAWEGALDAGWEQAGDGEGAGHGEHMLRRLRSLPWCRVDVSFKGHHIPFLAHTHIQVSRRWLDSVGMSVAEHISNMVWRLEEAVGGCADVNPGQLEVEGRDAQRAPMQCAPAVSWSCAQ